MVFYFLLIGNEDGMFFFDLNFGNLILRKLLDCEVCFWYSLMVCVFDNVFVFLMKWSFVIVNIIILDFNDNLFLCF